MTTKMKRGKRWSFHYLVNLYFIYFLLKNQVSAFNFFAFNCNFDFFFLFSSVMTNNQTKPCIIYKKIAMRADGDERMINYESRKVRTKLKKQMFDYIPWLNEVF